MHVCMYACMHVCMYACMHVCMCVSFRIFASVLCVVFCGFSAPLGEPVRNLYRLEAHTAGDPATNGRSFSSSCARTAHTGAERAIGTLTQYHGWGLDMLIENGPGKKHVFTKSFRYIPIMAVLSLIRLFWGWVFPYISRIHHTAYIGFCHFQF